MSRRGGRIAQEGLQGASCPAGMPRALLQGRTAAWHPRGLALLPHLNLCCLGCLRVCITVPCTRQQQSKAAVVGRQAAAAAANDWCSNRGGAAGVGAAFLTS
jgi:hypothetical protein